MLYFYNMALGESYLVTIPPSGFSCSQNKEKNMIWEYSFTLTTLAPLTSLKNKSKKSALSKTLIDGNNDTFLAAKKDEKSLEIELNFGKNTPTKGIMLREYMPKGQHIKSFEIEGFDGNNWTNITKGTTIGNRRILTWNSLNISKLRVKILDAFDTINLSGIEVY